MSIANYGAAKQTQPFYAFCCSCACNSLRVKSVPRTQSLVLVGQLVNWRSPCPSASSARWHEVAAQTDRQRHLHFGKN